MGSSEKRIQGPQSLCLRQEFNEHHQAEDADMTVRALHISCHPTYSGPCGLPKAHCSNRSLEPTQAGDTLELTSSISTLRKESPGGKTKLSCTQ